LQACLDGYADAKTPMQIVDHFFSHILNAKDEADKVARLFKFVQYIERQIVLFDAIEYAALKQLTTLKVQEA
jgi:phosphoenolpyruvate carboxylase